MTFIGADTVEWRNYHPLPTRRIQNDSSAFWRVRQVGPFRIADALEKRLNSELEIQALKVLNRERTDGLGRRLGVSQYQPISAAGFFGNELIYLRQPPLYHFDKIAV